MVADEGSLARTNRWVQSRFSQYYARAQLDLPPRFTKREWAFLFFDKSFMVRHLAFTKRDQLQAYLRDQAPRHAYYSTAFYQDPGAHTMAEKGWKGATLVFDLDADHLEGAAKMGYAEMLAAVKVEFVKLVDRWLIGKLGYDADDVHIVFSGGRGYHAHIEDNRVLELGSYERREIIDRISGNPVDLSKYLEISSPDVVIASGRSPTGRGYSKKTFKMPSESEGNWRGDVTREAKAFFLEIKQLVDSKKRPEAVERIKVNWNTDSVKAIYLLEELLKQDVAGYSPIDRILINGTIDFSEGLGPEFWKPFFRNIFIRTLGEADEPVTSDIKRLIRLPNSIHGKTGFRVVTLTRDELTEFDPLTDALAFSKDKVEIEGLVDSALHLGGGDYSIEKGKRISLPEHAAMFACLRGSAAIPGAD